MSEVKNKSVLDFENYYDSLYEGLENACIPSWLAAGIMVGAFLTWTFVMSNFAGWIVTAILAMGCIAAIDS